MCHAEILFVGVDGGSEERSGIRGGTSSGTRVADYFARAPKVGAAFRSPSPGHLRRTQMRRWSAILAVPVQTSEHLDGLRLGHAPQCTGTGDKQRAPRPVPARIPAAP